MLGFIPGFWRS